MSDVAVATTPAKAAPKKKAPSKPKAPAAHPQYKVMVAAAISALKERGGSSRQAILKYIIANYKVGDNPTAVNARVKTALRAGVKDGTLKQAKGTGAAGSFRLGDKKVEKKPVKKVAKKPKSPKKVAKKPKSPKKVAKPKKPKSPKKAAATAKKPAAKKAAAKPKKATKSPAKKAAKPKVAKKPAAKKAAAKPKKSAAKK
ncbi:histone H1-delta-like [Aplysia californica]|uniref:Histone H1-delta-like n=1 Tax=Aplysia californica TaxID=6500 RepID=A0ABM0K761_APLCA|nr:histone H1-delta-like [Aplysia californica]